MVLKLCGAASKCRVIVNRKVVQNSTRLYNGDSIVFGRAFTMILVVVEEERKYCWGIFYVDQIPGQRMRPIENDFGNAEEELENSKAFQKFSRNYNDLREEVISVLHGVIFWENHSEILE